MYKIIMRLENVLKKSYCWVSPYSRLILFYARDQKSLGLRPVVLCVCVRVCWGGVTRYTRVASSPGSPIFSTVSEKS